MFFKNKKNNKREFYIPLKFNFKDVKTGGKFVAMKSFYYDKEYIVWKNGEDANRCSIRQTDSEVRNNLQDGNWIIIKEGD